MSSQCTLRVAVSGLEIENAVPTFEVLRWVKSLLRECGDGCR